MNKNTSPNLWRSMVLSLVFFSGSLQAATASQYNMSLQNKVVSHSNGALTSPQAAAVNTLWEIEEERVTKMADGIYRIAGWGIGNIIAVEGSEGWIIVDTGDYLEVALKQRKALEEQVGRIKVAAVLYTHSHYAMGAKAWQDEATEFYGHEELVATLRGDQGVSVLAGNFNTRAIVQFGMLHPKKGPDAFPNDMGFSVEKLSGTKAFVAPTKTFKDGVVERHDIAGLTVEVLPSKTDVRESVAYYFPERKLLVSNALNAGSIFNLYTLRGDWYRNPMDYVEAADLALARDIELHIDIHGSAKKGKTNVIAGLEEARDAMQLINDQTYRAISLGKDAQGAAEYIYLPESVRKDKETYGQVESHVKQVYGARIGWMGWDIYDINPLSKSQFSANIIRSMGGVDAVIEAARNANESRTLAEWQWSIYLTSQLLTVDPANSDAKKLRAEAARALGQRTTSANARGFYISEALLHEGRLQFGEYTIDHYQQLSQVLGAVTPEKLNASPLDDNVQYLRYMVNPQLTGDKRVEFNVSFTDEGVSYGIVLRNGIIAITGRLNEGKTFKLTKAEWGLLIIGEKRFANLDAPLVAVDQAIGR